jgi:hypothetical protein
MSLAIYYNQTGRHNAVAGTQTRVAQAKRPYRRKRTMSVEPPGKIQETRIISREESAAFQQRKKQSKKEEPQKNPEKTGKIDIKI